MHKKLIAWTLAAGMLIMPFVSSAQAQGGGQGGGWGGGGGGGRNRNDPKMRLSGLWRNMGRLESGKAALTKAQARRIVALVRPWSAKPKMTETDAKSLYIKMNAVLTTRQKNEMDKMAAMRRRTARDGGDRQGGGQGGGQRGNRDPQQMQQMRAQMQRMQGFMKTMNPFYPPTKYREIKSLPARMQQRFTRRYRGSRATLTVLARKAA